MSTDTQNEDVFQSCEAFLNTYCKEEMGRIAMEADGETPPTLHVNWQDLHRYDPMLAEDYLEQPETIEGYLSEALAATMPLPANLTETDIRGATVRASNLPDHRTFDVGNYQPTNVVGTFQGVRGQVSRVTTPQTLAETLVFECQRCGTYTPIPQSVEQEQEPGECEGCERSGPFRRVHEQSEFVDYQRVRLETPPEKAGREGSESLDVTLRDDLVRGVRPGERVTLNTEIDIEPSSDDRPTFNVTGEVASIEHSEEDLQDVAVEEHREDLEELAERDDKLEAILNSIAPSIYGHDKVKEALALQLFGAVHREKADGSERRGTINVLLIGDPGTGKTRLLKYVSRLAPRSLYTSGEGTTSAGLTAAAVQDDFGGGGWTIKAGALVQAHNGVCCIDELDDMDDDDRAGMLEAMSSQTISKTAAGQSVTLPARTTVLAGANPVNGRFDPHVAIADQVDLKPTLISRFDLMFTFRDEQDTERDSELAKHMTAASRDDEAEQHEPEIEPDVLRAYIAQARRNFDPTLSPTADTHLRERYVEIRQANDDDGPIPTTPRLLDSMVRLAEASARLRHSDTVTKEDAERAADLAVSCLQQVGVDPETGEFDADIVETGSSKVQRERIQAASNILDSMEKKYAGGVPVDDFLDTCEDSGIDRDKAEHVIQKLKKKGDIYEPSTDKIKSV